MVNTRKLGKDGPQLPVVGFGLMNLAGVYGDIPNEADAFALLDRALEMGNIFWDTADVYGFNDELLAKWFARTGARSKIFLASKFGIVMERGTTNFKGIDSSGRYCKQACDQMLARLGTTYLDLYYAHRIHPGTPIEETMRAMAELKEEGKIKHIGLCGVSSSALRRAVKIAPVACVQTEYSPIVRDIESDQGTNLLKTCRDLGVVVIASSPLSRGLLTTRFNSSADLSHARDIRGKQMPRFQAENLYTNAEIVANFGKMAQKMGCTSSQLALAWILKQGKDLFVIPGTTKMKYLEENWDAANVELTVDDERKISAFLKSIELKGASETAAGKAFAFVDTIEGPHAP